MKVKLNIRERLAVISIMPEEESFMNMKLGESIKKKMEFTEKEHAEFGVEQRGHEIVWNTEADREVEKDLTAAEIGLLVAQLKKLDTAKKINVNHVTLWEKVVT